MSDVTTMPIEVRNNVGAGWEIFTTLPAGFKFSLTGNGADGATPFMTWTLVESRQIFLGCERWVQFETEEWRRMQSQYARLFAAAPDILAALTDLQAFVCVMFGNGEDATIPETARTPLGVDVKLADIMRNVHAAIEKARGTWNLHGPIPPCRHPRSLLLAR